MLSRDYLELMLKASEHQTLLPSYSFVLDLDFGSRFSYLHLTVPHTAVIPVLLSGLPLIILYLAVSLCLSRCSPVALSSSSRALLPLLYTAILSQLSWKILPLPLWLMGKCNSPHFRFLLLLMLYYLKCLTWYFPLCYHLLHALPSYPIYIYQACFLSKSL